MGGRRVRRAAGGFTLIELLVVLLIVAVASGAATLALRDGDQMRLDREAERLAAVLESARAQSRSSGLPVRWQATSDGQGFQFLGLPHARLSHPWLQPTLVLRGGLLTMASAVRRSAMATCPGAELLLPTAKVAAEP